MQCEKRLISSGGPSEQALVDISHGRQMPNECMLCFGFIFLTIVTGLTWGNERVCILLIIFWILLLVGIFFQVRYRYRKSREMTAEKVAAVFRLRGKEAKLFGSIGEYLQNFGHLTKSWEAHILAKFPNHPFMLKPWMVLRYCEPSYINERLVTKWWANAQFQSRREIIESALEAYNQRKYSRTLRGILPQARNIAMEWITQINPAAQGSLNAFKSLFSKFKHIPADVYTSGIAFLLADVIYYIVNEKTRPEVEADTLDFRLAGVQREIDLQHQKIEQLEEILSKTKKASELRDLPKGIEIRKRILEELEVEKDILETQKTGRNQSF